MARRFTNLRTVAEASQLLAEALIWQDSSWSFHIAAGPLKLVAGAFSWHKRS